MCPLLQISSLLIVLCVSGVFSSPSIHRNAVTYEDCRVKCGKFFTGVVSDDVQYACIKGCCSSSLRSLSHHVNSEILQDKEEERFDGKTELQRRYPKTMAWTVCLAEKMQSSGNMFKSVSACCKSPPV